jgi:hypothetical protein
MSELAIMRESISIPGDMRVYQFLCEQSRGTCPQCFI